LDLGSAVDRERQKSALIPVVLQRQALADALARYMSMLGLERRQKVKTIPDLLAGSPEQPASETRQSLR